MTKVKKTTKTGVVEYQEMKNKKEVKFVCIAEDKTVTSFTLPRAVFDELNEEVCACKNEVAKKEPAKKPVTKKK